MNNWYKKAQSNDLSGNPLSSQEEDRIRQKYQLFDPSKKIHPDRIKQDILEQSEQSRIPKDFSFVDVRRMSGIFEDYQSLSKEALEEMNEWLANGEFNITPEEAKKRLSYYLARMRIE